jgi:outer membrane protein/protease secretion system outer membrane protein
MCVIGSCMRWFVFVIGCLVAAAGVRAERLTLTDLYEISVRHDAAVRAARAAVAAAAERLPQAQSQGLPQFILSAERFSNQLRMVSRQDQYDSSSRTLQIRQPLVRLGLAASIEQAVRAHDEATALQENAEQDLLTRLSGALFEHLLAIEQRDYVLALKQASSTQLQAAERSLLAGSGVRTDVDEARARLDAARAQELQVQLQIEMTRRQLERLGGRSLGQLALLTVEDPWAKEPALDALPLWLERANNHPQLRALRARAQAARHEVTKAQAVDMPTLDAVARWTRSDSENVFNPGGSYRNHQIGLQFNWPLYQGGASQAAVREALARVDEAEHRLLATRDELAQRLEGQYRLVQEGRSRIEALRQAAYSARQALVSSRRSFQAGSRTQLDVLNAEQALAQAMRDLAQGRLSYLQAQLQLALHAGHEPVQAMARIRPWFSLEPTRPQSKPFVAASSGL